MDFQRREVEVVGCLHAVDGRDGAREESGCILVSRERRRMHEDGEHGRQKHEDSGGK